MHVEWKSKSAYWSNMRLGHIKGVKNGGYARGVEKHKRLLVENDSKPWNKYPKLGDTRGG